MSAPDDDSNDLWLREMVDDDLLPLFADDEESQQRGARRLLRAVTEDPDLEQRLIELLETSLEQGNDDTQASVLTTYILGEARSRNAIGILLRVLGSEDDETLQDAAQVALLRIGSPAIVAILERLEEDENPVFCRAAYQLLGQAGILQDRALLEGITSFLVERLAAERQRPRSESVIEHVCHTAAQLGDRRLLPFLQQVLSEDFRGRNAAIRDACEQLEENAAGEPFVPTLPPWSERYGWLLGGEPDRRKRPDQRRPGADDESHDDRASARSRQSRLLWGLNAFVGDTDEGEGLDARQYLDRPGGSGADDEDDGGMEEQEAEAGEAEDEDRDED